MRALLRGVLAMVVALFVAMAGAALAQSEGKFRPSTRPGGWGRFVVTVSVQPGEDVETLSRRLAATYRGRLEPFAQDGFRGFAITMTEPSARLMSRDPHVVMVDGAASLADLPATGASASARPVPLAQATQPLLASTEESALPASPGMPEARTKGSAAAVHLRPGANDTGSSWSTGTYVYDGSGNIRSMGTDAYVYDRFHRLTSGTAGPGKAQTYIYDRYGNMTTITTSGNAVTRDLGVHASTNQATESASPHNAYGTYDAAGNVKTWSTGKSFEYDGLGMMRQWTIQSAKTLYIYSASDERIAAIALDANNVETRSLWTLRDLSGKVLRRLEKTGAGSSATWTWKEDYIYRGTQLLAAETSGPEHTLHFHPDHLGTPRLITGNGGSKVALHTYYPFGEEATSDLQDQERLKFTGHERDSATLDSMHARYYSPVAGRFLSVDPVIDVKKAIRQPQMWNRYSYVMNNPMLYTDPTGKIAATTAGIDRDLKERRLTDERDALSKYAQTLSAQVKAGKLDSKKAVDMYFDKAKELTKGTKNATENALLVATGAAIAIRGSVSNNITRPSMGQDTLHHYFLTPTTRMAEFRCWRRALGQTFWVRWSSVNNFKMENDPKDFDANNFGAVFGDDLQSNANTKLSSVMP